mmetsp:Transcript_47847/g.113690  ORF Transcript_47847/g.113690 Transcript_47847/m.113690 type:complete len:251 (+) Transcript_47847:91-843(+)
MDGPDLDAGDGRQHCCGGLDVVQEPSLWQLYSSKVPLDKESRASPARGAKRLGHMLQSGDTDMVAGLPTGASPESPKEAPEVKRLRLRAKQRLLDEEVHAKAHQASRSVSGHLSVDDGSLLSSAKVPKERRRFRLIRKQAVDAELSGSSTKDMTASTSEAAIATSSRGSADATVDDNFVSGMQSALAKLPIFWTPQTKRRRKGERCTAAAQTGTTQELGCSKCRFAKRGCSQCRLRVASTPAPPPFPQRE